MLLGNFSAALYECNEHARAEVKAAARCKNGAQWQGVSAAA